MTTVHLYTDQGRKPKPKEQIQQEMAIIIGNGGRYFAWDNPTQESGLVEEQHQFMGKVVALFLRDRQKWCMFSKRLADVSLLHSAANHYAMNRNNTRVFIPKPDYLQVVTESLNQLHLNYEFVTDHHMLNQKINTTLLVVNDMVSLPDSVCNAIQQYVENGGSLLITGNSLTLPGLKEISGLSVISKSSEKKNLTIAIMNDNYHFMHHIHNAKTESAHTIIKVQDKNGRVYSFLTEHTVGKGKVYGLTIPISEVGEIPYMVLDDLFKRILPENNRMFVSDISTDTELCLRQKKNNILFMKLTNRRETV
jgi:hypothetical protein